jgi:large subunit ribosomal protein L17
MSLTTSHAKMLYRNMATSLITYEKVVTTLTKAKYVRSYVEKLVTIAKAPSLAAQRRVAAKIKDDKARKKLFNVLGPRYAERKGGYVQVLKMAPRVGDGAPMALVRFVQ